MQSPLRTLFVRSFREPAGVLVNAIRRRDRETSRAFSLINLGDTLSSARPRGWRARALRAYVKATRVLGPAPDAATEITLQAAARRAHALARSRQGPVWSAAVRLTVAIGVAAVALFGVLWGAAPGFRALVAPVDLAKRAPWESSSKDEGFPQHGVSPLGAPLFFHTQREDHPWLVVDLSHDAKVSAVMVDNRTDCCRERALPLDVEVLQDSGFRLVCQRRSPFSSFTCRFPPVKTRAVRVRLAGKGALHLSRVAVFE
jgi:hypothetical protein